VCRCCAACCLPKWCVLCKSLLSASPARIPLYVPRLPARVFAPPHTQTLAGSPEHYCASCHSAAEVSALAGVLQRVCPALKLHESLPQLPADAGEAASSLAHRRDTSNSPDAGRHAASAGEDAASAPAVSAALEARLADPDWRPLSFNDVDVAALSFLFKVSAGSCCVAAPCCPEVQGWRDSVRRSCCAGHSCARCLVLSSSLSRSPAAGPCCVPLYPAGVVVR
jgi:hypothetical protein